MKCRLRVYPSGDLLGEGVTPAEDVAADIDELVRVRGVGQIVHREHEDLGKAPRVLLVSEGVLLHLLHDLAVGVGGGDFGLELLDLEVALVLELSRGYSATC